MPIYEYRCTACGRSFEALMARWDAPAPACEHCGAAHVERKLSVFAVSAPTSGTGPACGDPGATCGPGGCGCCSSLN